MVKDIYVKLVHCICITVYCACAIYSYIFAFASCKLQCTTGQKFFDDATASVETA